MSLPFKTHMIPLQHKIIYCSCKTVSSCLQPKGTLNHIPLGNFTSYVLRMQRLTLEVGELVPQPPSHPPGQCQCAQNRAVPRGLECLVNEKRKTKTHKWLCSSSRDNLLSEFFHCSHPWQLRNV